MAIRRNLLIHGLVFRFRNALVGNRWKIEMVSKS
jgi:hypothetical protein